MVGISQIIVGYGKEFPSLATYTWEEARIELKICFCFLSQLVDRNLCWLGINAHGKYFVLEAFPEIFDQRNEKLEIHGRCCFLVGK